ncbi:hypothetical protein ABZ820_28880 [Streptomyces diacarni]|uniref:hypothetical protein n=1 Tax=Streptomyces diacarni TaxID=2800381 RepID=UPI0033CA74FD
MNEHAYSRSRNVEECVAGLHEALRAHGLTLPSLGVDPVTYAGYRPDPLIALGNCNVDTVRALTAVLRAAAAEGRVEGQAEG